MEQVFVIHSMEDFHELLTKFSYLSVKTTKITLDRAFTERLGLVHEKLEQDINDCFNACGCAEGAQTLLIGLVFALIGIVSGWFSFWYFFPIFFISALAGKIYGIWKGQKALERAFLNCEALLKQAGLPLSADVQVQ